MTAVIPVTPACSATKDIRPKTAGKPIMLVHGTIDEILPTDESRKLHAAAHGNTELWVVAGASHCGSFLHPDYSQRIAEFLNRPATDALALRNE